MAYTSASAVAAYCQSLLGSQDNFSESSSPTISEVNTWLAAGYSTINTYLAAWGYDTPVGSTAGIYDMLGNMNAVYAAARAEFSRLVVGYSNQERTRGQVLNEMFNADLKRLEQLNLTGAGATKSTTYTGKLFAGGISVASKDTYESDTDRVTPRFRRGMFQFTGTIDPSGYTSASATSADA